MADRRGAEEDSAENDEEPLAERKQWRVRLRAGDCTVTLEEDAHFILVKPIPMETRPARDEVGRAEVGVDDEDEGMAALRELRAEGLRPAWRRMEPRFKAHDTVAVRATAVEGPHASGIQLGELIAEDHDARDQFNKNYSPHRRKFNSKRQSSTQFKKTKRGPAFFAVWRLHESGHVPPA